MSTLIKGNRNSEQLIQQLSSLEKSPGTCIFIDLVNSTKIKYEKEITDWGRMINNTFNYISFLSDLSDHVVKGIGDEIMIFIPDDVLHKVEYLDNYHSILSELCATLFNIKNSPLSDDFYDCKMVIHYCSDVYNISFLEGFNDYYGKDIDLTARLMSKAKPNTVVLSEVFYEKADEEWEKRGLHSIESFVESISKPFEEEFRGIPTPVQYRIIEI